MVKSVLYEKQEWIFLKAIDLDVWDSRIYGPFIYTHLINNEVINKSRVSWSIDK